MGHAHALHEQVQSNLDFSHFVRRKLLDGIDFIANRNDMIGGAHIEAIFETQQEHEEIPN